MTVVISLPVDVNQDVDPSPGRIIAAAADVVDADGHGTIADGNHQGGAPALAMLSSLTSRIGSPANSLVRGAVLISSSLEDAIGILSFGHCSV